MPSLNKNEYGQVVRVNMLEDVSTNTLLKFILEPSVGDKLEKAAADGVVVGTSNVTVDDESYLANEYLEYTIKDGDLTFVGSWRLKGEVDINSTKKVVGDYKIIEVLA